MIEQTVGNSGHGNSLSTSIRWMFYMENFWAFPCQTFGSACVSDGSRWELPRGGAISPCWNVHHFEKRSTNYKWPFSIAVLNPRVVWTSKNSIWLFWMSLKHWKVLVVFNDVFFGEQIGSCSAGFGKKILRIRWTWNTHSYGNRSILASSSWSGKLAR